MPVPKRWHPVSRDLNDDPEVWELTVRFGDRAVRVLLEVLANIDKTENHWLLSGRWNETLARKVRMKSKTIQRILCWMVNKGWLEVMDASTEGQPLAYRAPNYAKYHRTRETKPSPLTSPLTSLDETNLKKKEIFLYWGKRKN